MAEPMRVLLVDDNPHDRALVERELRNAFGQLEVVNVRDPDELNRALEQPPFALVITDYRLRWTTGLDVLRQVKARSPYTAVVMFTGTGTEEVAVEAMKAGLDDYVIKNPHHLVRLRSAALAAIERLCERRRAEQAELRLNLLLDRLSVGVFRCDTAGMLLDWNDTLPRLLEADPSADSDVPQNGAVRGAVRDRFRRLLAVADVQDAWQRTLAEGVGTAETRIQWSPDEMPRWYRVSFSRTQDAGETVIDGLIEDITGRKEAELQLQRRAAARQRIERLAPRELELLRNVVAGVPNKAIARMLGISEKTVEKYRATLIRKLGVRTTAEAVRIAAEAGLHE